jgi:hypothetical protein
MWNAERGYGFIADVKSRGQKLGGNRGVKPTAKMRARSTAVLQQRADSRVADIAPIIKRPAGCGLGVTEGHRKGLETTPAFRLRGGTANGRQSR